MYAIRSYYEVMAKIQSGDTVIVDGLDGKVIVNPSAEVLEQYQLKRDQYLRQIEEWKKLKEVPTQSKDGVHVELGANIGTPNDVTGVLENGGEAVGLYRTEFLYT